VVVVERGKNQLALVDVSSLLINNDYETELSEIVPLFKRTFTDLLNVIRVESAPVSHPTHASTAPPSSGTTFQKRSTTPPPSPPPKRPKTATGTLSPPGPKTPDAPPLPEDPDRTGGSNESKVEVIAQVFIVTFLEDVRFFLARHFTKLQWVQCTSKPKIDQSSYQLSHLF
jgi:hypothetical protein